MVGPGRRDGAPGKKTDAEAVATMVAESDVVCPGALGTVEEETEGVNNGVNDGTDEDDEDDEDDDDYPLPIPTPTGKGGRRRSQTKVVQKKKENTAKPPNRTVLSTSGRL